MASLPTITIPSRRFKSLRPLKASLNPNPIPKINPNPILNSIPNLAATLVLSAAAAAAAAVLRRPPPTFAAESTPQTLASASESSSPLSKLIATNPSAAAALRSLLYQTLATGEDDAEALKILNRLLAASPDDIELNFLAARLHNELGNPSESRRILEQILETNPLSFEPLFQLALLLDRCGEGTQAVERLEKALEVAKAEKDKKAERDVRLIVAQIRFLQKDVEGAMKSYDELAKEDKGDYRPYFCRGVILSLLEKNEEAREMFRKCREVAPKEFEVDAYLQTPLSRMRLFGTEDSQA